MLLEHVGITVADLDRSARFYAQFGFRELRGNEHLRLLHRGDDALIELVKRQGDAPRPPAPRSWDDLAAGLGNVHLGFRVESLHEALALVDGAGGVVLSEPRELPPPTAVADPSWPDRVRRAAAPISDRPWRMCLVADPDGSVCELIER